MGSANMAEKVKLRSSDGRVFEADVKTVMSMSGLLKNVIEDTGTDAVISVPEVSGDILQLAIQFLESRSSLLGTPSVPYFDMRSVAATLLKECVSFSNAYDQNFDITRSGREILGDEKRHLHAGKKHRAGTINVDDRETHEDERSWEEKEHDASFVNQVCSKFDWDTIKGLHEAAKYLDIPSLQFLTGTLISQAPSRAFLGVVSPWLDCDGLEGYRKLEVEVF